MFDGANAKRNTTTFGRFIGKSAIRLDQMINDEMVSAFNFSSLIKIQLCSVTER